MTIKPKNVGGCFLVYSDENSQRVRPGKSSTALPGTATNGIIIIIGRNGINTFVLAPARRHSPPPTRTLHLCRSYSTSAIKRQHVGKCRPARGGAGRATASDRPTRTWTRAVTDQAVTPAPLPAKNNRLRHAASSGVGGGGGRNMYVPTSYTDRVTAPAAVDEIRQRAGIRCSLNVFSYPLRKGK